MLIKVTRLLIIFSFLMLLSAKEGLALTPPLGPITGGDLVIENTSIRSAGDPNGSTNVFEQTLRINLRQKLGDKFYLAARLKLYNINQKEYRGQDRELFDQYLLGYKNKDTEFLGGKQWLWLGQGLLADINIIGASLRTNFPKNKGYLMGFYSNKIQAVDLNVKLGSGLSTGVTYKRAKSWLNGFDRYYIYNGINNLERLDPELYRSTNFHTETETSYAFNVRQDLKHGVTLGAEYVYNTTQKADGYLIAVRKGFYTLSWRNVEPAAFDPAHSTNYHYAGSRGWRIRADYSMFGNTIFTVYYDISSSTDKVLNRNKNILYTGIAYYF